MWLTPPRGVRSLQERQTRAGTNAHGVRDTQARVLEIVTQERFQTPRAGLVRFPRADAAVQRKDRAARARPAEKVDPGAGGVVHPLLLVLPVQRVDVAVDVVRRGAARAYEHDGRARLEHQLALRRYETDAHVHRREELGDAVET